MLHRAHEWEHDTRCPIVGFSSRRRAPVAESQRRGFQLVGDLARAREQFVAAKEANPNYLQARILLAILHLTGGENASAIQELERVLELNPGNKSAEMYLRIASKRPSELPST